MADSSYTYATDPLIQEFFRPNPTWKPPRLVKYGDYIAFPLEQTNDVTIKWYVNKRKVCAKYFVDKCLYGTLEEPTGPEAAAKPLIDRFVPLGETPIFIAAEMIDPRYCKGPEPMRKFHLLDIHEQNQVKSEEGTQPDAGAESPWGVFKIDENFHYGQNRTHKKNPTFRYIVYHPHWDPNHPPRAMYQHRFFETTLINRLASAGALYAGGVASAFNDGAGFVADVVANEGMNLARASIGHPLWRFGAIEAQERKAQVEDILSKIKFENMALDLYANYKKEVEPVLGHAIGVQQPINTNDPVTGVPLNRATMGPTYGIILPPVGNRDGNFNRITDGTNPSLNSGAANPGIGTQNPNAQPGKPPLDPKRSKTPNQNRILNRPGTDIGTVGTGRFGSIKNNNVNQGSKKGENGEKEQNKEGKKRNDSETGELPSKRKPHNHFLPPSGNY